MGVKRKASDSLSPCSTSTVSSSPNSIDTPPPSMTFQSLNSSNQHVSTGWNSPEPYFASGMLTSSPHSSTTDVNTNLYHHHLNSRTCKRFRDNRPDEETIHQATLSKLYAAQRQARRGENQVHPNMPPTPSPSPSPSPTSPSFDIMDSTASSVEEVSPEPITVHDGSSKGQTSLHAFFGGTSTTTTSMTFKSSHPTFRVLGRDPQSSRSNIHHPHHDCSLDNGILAEANNDTDADMMDLDMDVNLDSTHDPATSITAAIS